MSFKDLTRKAADALKSKPAAASTKEQNDQAKEAQGKQPAPKPKTS